MEQSEAVVLPRRPAGTGLGTWARRNVQLILGLLVSAWSLWQLSQAVDLREVAHYLGSANWLLLTVSFASITVAMVIKCIRWRYLFANESAPPIPPLLSSLYIGYLANTVLPARVGELLRAVLIGREKSVGTPAALATIVVEKLLDLGTLALLLIGLILVVKLPDWVTPIAYTSAAALVGGFVALGLMVVSRRRVVAFVACLEDRVPLLRRVHPAELAASFLEGLARLGDRDKLPGLLFWSVVVWGVGAFSMWSGVLGSGVSVELTAVLLALVVTNIGMAVPSAPGYVGVYHYLVVKSLEPFGVDANQAAAAATLMHASVFGNFILGGVWFLWRGGHSLGGLREAATH